MRGSWIGQEAASVVGSAPRDECLPLGSLDAVTLRLLREKEREQRRALEHEVARLSAGRARQNERIIVLERENAGLREQGQLLRVLVDDRSEPGTRLRVSLLRQQGAAVRRGAPA
jgi:hypothetical protein